jgi:hypothetical protein
MRWPVWLGLFALFAEQPSDANLLMAPNGVVSNVEEFPGPFASWTNVKTSCGATGNGTTDDTTAIQTCLTAISPSAPVLYFPAGTYKITQPLNLKSQIYISLIGQDPTTTKILWAGISSGTTAASFTATITNNSPSLPVTNTMTVSSSGFSGVVKVGQLVHNGAFGHIVYVTADLTGGGGPGNYLVNTTNGSYLTLSSSATTTTDENMLFLNGVAYSRIDRLTLDGGSLISIGIHEEWNGIDNYFDTGDEYADDTFQNMQIGITCGNLAGCADVSVIRSTFTGLTDVGVTLNNFNALDVYAWYSLFSGNRIGMSNSSNFFGNGAGNFHSMDSKFLANTEADINIANTGTFNFGSNYSSGSGAFIEGGGSNSVNAYVLSGNTVLDPVATNAVDQGSLGPMMVINNVFRSASGASVGPVVNVHNGSFATDIFSYGNTYTLSTATCGGVVQVSNSGHCHSVSDQIVSRGSVNPAAPTLPPTPSNHSRQLFEASVSGSGTTCSTGAPCSLQTAITQAAACSCANPVVHINPGTYNLATTVTVPANFPIQLVGDGFVSRLAANGANPVLKLTGPSKATLSNFSCNGNAGASTCIEANSSDQTGGRVFIDQGHSTLSSKNFLIDSLDKTSVELHLPENTAAGTVGLEVIGGASAASGTWLGSTTNVFGGITSDNALAYQTTNGARLTLWGPWNDIGSGGAQVLGSTGAFGAITYAGSKILTGSLTSVILNNFQSVAGLVGLYLDGNISLSGTGSGAQDLGGGLVGATNTFFGNTTSPAATTVFINGFSRQSPPPLSDASELAETGSVTAPFLAATLAQLIAATPVQRTGTPSGVTDIGIYRLFIDRSVNGIWIH